VLGCRGWIAWLASVLLLVEVKVHMLQWAANIYLTACLEAPAKLASQYWPALYRRFMDDGFFAWERPLSLGMRLAWWLSCSLIACCPPFASRGGSASTVLHTWT
jgi:hypothetical protein